MLGVTHTGSSSQLPEFIPWFLTVYLYDLNKLPTLLETSVPSLLSRDATKYLLYLVVMRNK